MLSHVEAGEKIVMCMCKIRGGGAQWSNAGGRAVLLIIHSDQYLTAN